MAKAANKLHGWLLVLMTTCWFTGLNAQTGDDLLAKTVHLSATQGTVSQLLGELEAHTGCTFSYGSHVLHPVALVAVSRAEQTLEAHLHDLLKGKPVAFSVTGNRIIFKRSQQHFTISGYLKDADSGEGLIGATIRVAGTAKGSAANQYGYYSLTLVAGSYALEIDYIGYSPTQTTVELTQPIRQDFNLSQDSRQLPELTVTEHARHEALSSLDMGATRMTSREIKALPALLGEPDVLKAIQAQTGIKTVGEGASNFYVRGGNLDQNLMLLDEAPVYNPSHLLGFVSVFNPDAVKSIEAYKAGTPSTYGGRLSSVLDIRMKEGNSKRWRLSGGISPVSSRITVEGPLVKDRSSVILSGRRSFVDLITSTANTGQDVWFHDLTLKANYKLNENNRIFASGYLGDDKFQPNASYAVRWGNTTGTLRWNHLYSQKLFSNLSIITSQYDYNITVPLEAGGDFEWNSGISDFNAKLDFNWYASNNLKVRFGANSIRHQFNLGKSGFLADGATMLEHAAYAEAEQSIGTRLKVRYGLRASGMQNIGAQSVLVLNNDRTIADTAQYSAGETFNTNMGLEPRLALRFMLNETNSLKASYTLNRQYVLMISNSTSSFTAFDLWIPAGENVPAQFAHQYALGWYTSLAKTQLEGSAEVYYKSLHNQIDFVDHAQLIDNPELETQMRVGTGEAYGIELQLRKTIGELTGTASYTYARTFRTFDGINNGRTFAATYDRPHDASLLLTWAHCPKWSFSGFWTYTSGRAVTLPVQLYTYADLTVPVYSERNGERFPAYHRMDVSATLTPKNKKNRRWQGSWTFSVYNAYNRHNTFAINFGRAVRDDGTITDPKFDHVRDNAISRTYLIGVLPSVTYNFKF